MGLTYSSRRAGASFLVLTMIAGAQLLVGTPAAQAQSLADRLKAVQSGQADRLTKLPAWKPVGSTTSTAMVPLVSGLTVVTAVSEPPLGDYESIKMITAVGQTAVQLHYSASQPKMELKGPLARRADNLGDADPMKEFPDKIACLRTIDVADLASAVAYSEVFCASPAEHFTGSTSIGASSGLLAKLKSGQAVEFHYANSNQWAVYAQQGAQIEGQKPVGAMLAQYAGQWMNACQLRRVGTTDVAVPVLLNGQRVELPALHASCAPDAKTQADFYWLDQAANPITLALDLDDTFFQAVQITFPPPATAPLPLETALAAKQPAQVYGIYFDFGSATIKPESELVLRQIADILQKNAGWKLSVSGHTDNVGDATANLALSQHRAAAVKDALVARFHIAVERLDTSGFGAGRPIDTNDTLEGRARNRRVELQRE
ncbi:MAG: OmpA family protein [Steroidobacteraceae bacterium]|jgi:outer membrane protein OmpA-like peptidoglycan-associated protein